MCNIPIQRPHRSLLSSMFYSIVSKRGKQDGGIIKYDKYSFVSLEVLVGLLPEGDECTDAALLVPRCLFPVVVFFCPYYLIISARTSTSSLLPYFRSSFSPLVPRCVASSVPLVLSLPPGLPPLLHLPSPSVGLSLLLRDSFELEEH